jgi:hypothetical protein
MHPSFGKNNSLADAVTSTLNRFNNLNLKEYLEEGDATHSSPQVQQGGLFYLEQPQNLERANAFIKRFLEGNHIDPEQKILHLFGHLHQIGLVVDGYKGEKSGTYDVYQYGKEIRNPEEDDATTSNILFPRRRMRGNLKINKTMVPGGQYMVDAELYMSRN